MSDWFFSDLVPPIKILRLYPSLYLAHASALEKKGHPVYRSIGDVHKAVYSAVCPIQQPVSTSVADRVDWCNAVADGTLGGLKARANCCCLALRDYYPFWRYKLEAQDAGKLLPVDVSPDSKVRLLPKSSRCSN